MADDSQLQIPSAFVSLYVEPGRIKPSLPRDELYRRFELCEDLSVLLVEQARGLIHEFGIAEEDVLVRIHRGLADEGSPVSEAEAGWVVGRLAEHLGWEAVLPGIGITAEAPPRSGRLGR